MSTFPLEQLGLFNDILVQLHNYPMVKKKKVQPIKTFNCT